MDGECGGGEVVNSKTRKSYLDQSLLFLDKISLILFGRTDLECME